VTSTEAIRKLEAAGWRVVRAAKHYLVEKDGRRATIPLGTLRGGSEAGVLRLLRDRGNGRDARREGAA
jgi:hypothetical protein